MNCFSLRFCKPACVKHDVSSSANHQQQHYRHQQLVSTSPRRVFTVQKDTSPAHGKRVYHRGFHWRGRWWKRNNNTHTGYDSDGSWNEDGAEEEKEVSQVACVPASSGCKCRTVQSRNDMQYY